MKKRHLVPVVAALAARARRPDRGRRSGSDAQPRRLDDRRHRDHPAGHRSLAAVLTADGNRFDRNWQDYDIVTEAVLAVLAAKPDSPVGLLTKGNVH